MTNRKQLVLTTVAALGLSFSAGTVAGGLDPDHAPKSTVEICVAEIGGHVDYSDAIRVRHDVVSEKRRTFGHILRIDTLVFDTTESEAVREYATICAVGTGEKPVKFKIKETGTQS